MVQRLGERAGLQDRLSARLLRGGLARLHEVAGKAEPAGEGELIADLVESHAVADGSG